ncbi:hypothetical protein PHYC_02293 [Phycisphaerales bacterium]|nr:hypothetical protein PHYC_02293 [Phycisphaerales bacterium]
MRTSRSTAGFTLIELLVVIATIALLIGLLLPALRGARESGRAARCMAATHEIGAALWMYEGANRGYIPREGTEGATPETLRVHIPWDVALRPYLDDRCSPTADLNDMFEGAPYYRCPSHPPQPHNIHFVANGFAFLDSGLPDERGTNDPAYRRGPMLASLVVAPDRMLYLTDLASDADSAMFNVWINLGNTDISIGQCYDAWLPRHLTDGSGDFRIGPRRHGTGSTALHLDGHAGQQPERFFLDVTNWDDGWHAR